MKSVSAAVSNRYIRRFKGSHESEWVDFDEKHIQHRFYLIDSNRERIAEVIIGKPLPKSTFIGHLIAIAIGAR